jgi:hypothetical protein
MKRFNANRSPLTGTDCHLMNRMTKYTVIITMLWHFVFSVSIAFAVDPNDIVRLKKAGVSDTVLKEIVRTDAIARALLSVDEIIKMKKVEVGDEVILSILAQGSADVPELDKEDAADRELMRELKRQELRLELLRKEFNIFTAYVSALITNPEIIKLVREGKISGKDYAQIVKYLKQYARDEETREYGDEGDITIDIDKTHR